ncbi:hypothetical protein [Streptomyces achromogenes]|uniref:hypothetical protein n=1 Tax=Streptomyces achromogenes TaxID=67255 RepID=UPI0033F0020C
MKGTHQRLNVGLGLGDLSGVRSPEFLELEDLLAQRALAVRRGAPGPDLVVELRLQVGVSLGERVARDAGLQGEGDDRQRSVRMLRCAAQDAVHRSTDPLALVRGWAHDGGS